MWRRYRPAGRSRNSNRPSPSLVTSLETPFSVVCFRRRGPDEELDDTANAMKHPHEHAAGAGAPGASGPGDPAFDGDVQLGDE
jgi:hypothetical protein